MIAMLNRRTVAHLFSQFYIELVLYCSYSIRLCTLLVLRITILCSHSILVQFFLSSERGVVGHRGGLPYRSSGWCHGDTRGGGDGCGKPAIGVLGDAATLTTCGRAR